MRKFLAGLLGMVLCVQTVYGIPGRAADVFESGERPKAMQDVIRQEVRSRRTETIRAI